MEETVVPKRPREESQVKEDLDDCEEFSKRHKPYNLILSLLESEEEDSTQDLSPLMTTLQHELITTCASHHDSDTLLSQPQNNSTQENLTTSISTTSCGNSNDIVVKEDKGDEKERVMRHLLEASDDELGIPSRVDHELLDFGEDMFPSTICDGLWELEDIDTANYYALLQSELFL